MSNIIGFIKSLLPGFSKSEAEEDLELSIENLKIAIESFSTWSTLEQTINYHSPDVKSFLTKFYKELNNTKLSVRLVKNNKLAKDLITLLGNAKLNGELLLEQISDSVSDVVMSQALTAYNANLLRSVPHYYFISNYALLLLNFIYIKESTNTGHEVDRDFLLNKKQEELLTTNISNFARMMAVYGEEPNKFKKNLDDIANLTLAKGNIDELADRFKGEKIDLFNNLPEGFVGSPIYSVRLIFAQWEADRYRTMKDKKRLLELRYLHYKMLQEQGTSDPTIEKEITYLQKRITDLDYKISKIERDL